MAASHTPLLQRPEDAPLAWLSKSLNGLDVSPSGRDISNQQFLAHVSAVASLLPEQRYAINLCDNRYLFLVATWAAITRGQTTLLPPNKNIATQENLLSRYADCYAVHDGVADITNAANSLDISLHDWRLSDFAAEVPQIDADHLAIISFTSGSTGESKPNLKYWRTLQESSRINARYMLPDDSRVYTHLATVPGQHMWGLETSVLLPVFANACLVDARPLYPQDIVDLLKNMPKPATIIGTPLHLRALYGASLQTEDGFPELASVLCATAPLDQTLAANIESRFNTELREVYGCSEVGSMAVRRTAQSDLWTPFEGLKFSQNSDAYTQVSADHLPETIELEDALEMVGAESFRLSGRATDQIKIAGKRGSLHEVNAVLSRFNGLKDGIVFFPPQDRPVPRLVAMVALEDNVNADDLRSHFRKYLDPAFVPRPILLVDALPREENGKLVKARLLEFYQATLRG